MALRARAASAFHGGVVRPAMPYAVYRTFCTNINVFALSTVHVVPQAHRIKTYRPEVALVHQPHPANWAETGVCTAVLCMGVRWCACVTSAFALPASLHAAPDVLVCVAARCTGEVPPPCPHATHPLEVVQVHQARPVKGKHTGACSSTLTCARAFVLLCVGVLIMIHLTTTTAFTGHLYIVTLTRTRTRTLTLTPTPTPTALTLT